MQITFSETLKSGRLQKSQITNYLEIFISNRIKPTVLTGGKLTEQIDLTPLQWFRIIEADSSDNS